jgi:hypothetical protein
MSKARAALSPEELRWRRENLDCVLGTTAAEGETPSPEALALFDGYASGELELADLWQELQQLHDSRIA